MSDDARTRLLAATVTCLGRYGIAKTTVDDAIVAAAGIGADDAPVDRHRQTCAFGALGAHVGNRGRAALAGLADLSTKVHLARFTGDAAQELTAQLARLAAAVDGASEVARIGRA